MFKLPAFVKIFQITKKWNLKHKPLLKTSNFLPSSTIYIWDNVTKFYVNLKLFVSRGATIYILQDAVGHQFVVVVVGDYDLLLMKMKTFRIFKRKELNTRNFIHVFILDNITHKRRGSQNYIDVCTNSWKS